MRFVSLFVFAFGCVDAVPVDDGPPAAYHLRFSAPGATIFSLISMTLAPPAAQQKRKVSGVRRAQTPKAPLINSYK